MKHLIVLFSTCLFAAFGFFAFGMGGLCLGIVFGGLLLWSIN